MLNTEFTESWFGGAMVHNKKYEVYHWIADSLNNCQKDLLHNLISDETNYYPYFKEIKWQIEKYKDCLPVDDYDNLVRCIDSRNYKELKIVIENMNPEKINVDKFFQRKSTKEQYWMYHHEWFHSEGTNDAFFIEKMNKLKKQMEIEEGNYRE